MASTDLDTFLHHLGIDPSENSLDIISQLMNCTLHCLGGIRVLFASLEKERVSNYVSASNEANRYKKIEEEYWAIKKTFAYANQRMLHEIMRSDDIHNLNPARHIIESFPNSVSYGKKDWLAVHWAILGKENYDEPDKVCAGGKHDQENGLELAPVVEINGTVPPLEANHHQHVVSVVDEQIVILNQLADVFPTNFKEVDKEKRSVLHIASRLDSVPLFEAVLKNCKRTNGSGIREANSNGALPLHNAARFSQSFALFQRVEEEYRDALKIKNKEGMLPLHWAAAKNRSVEIVRHLINSYPECIRIPNDEGYLPLHLAGQNDCLAVVKAVYEAYPEAISIHDHDGGLPIHHACSITKNLEVVKFLYEKYPIAITQPQEHGITPLHLAASQNDSPDLFTFIIEKAPEATNVRDAVGCYPLDCIVMRIKYGISSPLLDSLRIFFQHTRSIKRAGIDSGPIVSADQEEEFLTRKDYLTRLYLSSNSPKHPLLTEILLSTRRSAILLFAQLSRQHHLVSTNHEAYFVEKAISEFFLRKPTALNDLISPFEATAIIHQAASKRKVRSIVLIRLCQQFISPEAMEIPSGVLRNIIKFL